MNNWQEIIFQEAYKKMGNESPQEVAAFLERWVK